MNRLQYYIAKIKYIFFVHNYEFFSDFSRRGGVKIGLNCVICSYMTISEPFLVEIKDCCVISSNVSFVTHDHSINKVIPEKSNLFGKIIIGNNCFIGQGSTLLYGVELGDNIIVASGSVVTKSFDENNIIVAGNPAKKIGTWDEFRKKYADKAINCKELENIITENTDKLVRR